MIRHLVRSKTNPLVCVARLICSRALAVGASGDTRRTPEGHQKDTKARVIPHTDGAPLM